MNDLFKDIFQQFRDMNKEIQILAIWFDRPIMLGDSRKTARITDGDFIRVNTGYIVNCAIGQPANYQVLNCYGTLSGVPTRLQCLNLETNEIENITNFN